MSKKEIRLADYLGHILQAIDRIQQYTQGLDESTFSKNLLVQDAVIRNLEVIGEASKNIQRDSPAFAALHPGLPLALAYDMRNVLSHGYFKINMQTVWQTVQNNLPALQMQVTALLKSA